MAPTEKPLVVLAGPIHPDARALLETEARVTVSRHETEDGLVNDAREAAGILFRIRPNCTESLMASCKRLQVIGRHGVRLDAVDLPDELRARGAEPVALDQLLARSDVVTVHTPHTPETHHIISADAVAKMKPGVVFVNTCRGKTQDERALFEGLAKGKIRAAGLDV